jgi:hypothetical protein
MYIVIEAQHTMLANTLLASVTVIKTGQLNLLVRPLTVPERYGKNN